MKKRIIAIAITLTLFAALVPVSVSAASASARLSGPDSVRAGDTITVSFVLSGSGIYGASGTLSYDGLTLVSTSQSIGSPWIVEFNGNNFAARMEAIKTFGITNIPEYQSEKIAKYLYECLEKRKTVRRYE